ncbi:MAG: hypothetical protein Q8P22_04685 [Chloroflexota bacterium]|nr:hypothetical protein [Chloroflexota bacterium]
MSDVVAVALITGGTTGFVGIAGLALNLWNSSRERQLRLAEHREDYREWYRRTLFEDRLRAVREGYAWLMRLNRALSRADQGLDQMCLECREWWDNNAVFLYDDLPRKSEFIGFLNDPHGSGSFMRAEAEVRDRLRQILATERNDRSGAHDR